MDEEEKMRRCKDAVIIDDMCRVYTRWVGRCSDCSFDHIPKCFVIR